MRRQGRRLFSVSLWLFIAAPVAAQRPMPPAALRFEEALSRGDLGTAEGLIAPGESITDIYPSSVRSDDSPVPVTLARIAAAVRGCRLTPPSVTRDLRDRSKTHVFLSWECSRDNTSMNLDVVGGRMARIEVQFRPIPVPANPPGWVPPILPARELADSFLRRLVGERDFPAARELLAAKASVSDRRSGRRASLAAVANHVEACALGEVADDGARAVVTHWACRSGPRAIAIGFDRNNVSQVEIVSATSQLQR